ncbi:MAG: M48 family metallopeptidase [Actinomycetota bacterium]|nr:M48 family metallopeptidase [Actinomycetota bacterium]
MTAIEPAFRYEQISAQGFAHPADRAATAALHSVPLFDRAIKRLSEFQYERQVRQLFLGQAVRLGADQLPAIWSAEQRSAYVLDIAEVPKLYVTQQPIGNAMTIGTHEPVMLVNSGLVRSFAEDERFSVLAHEMGHVLADHVALTTAFQLVQQVLRGVLRAGPLAGLPLMGLYFALLEWSRTAELTADRAAALVVGDPLVPCRTLMRIAGGPIEEMNLDAFLRQAAEYEGEEDPFARWSRFFSEIRATHPFPVRRVKELMNWVAAGDFDRIRAGQYVRRGQEPPASSEFDVAFRHYRERFSTMVQRAEQGVRSVVDRVGGWLDRFDRDPGG